MIENNDLSNEEHIVFLKQLLKTHKRCNACVDGIDGETCGGVTYAGRCKECDGSGWVLKRKTKGK